MFNHAETAARMIQRYGTKQRALDAATDHAMSNRYDGNVLAEGYWLQVYRAIIATVSVEG